MGVFVYPPAPVEVRPPAIITDPNNSTDTPLAGGGSFVGTLTDIDDYAQVNITVYAEPSTAKGSLFLEFSPDGGTNWDIPIPHIVRLPTLVIPVPLINVAGSFRVRYLNDGGAAAIAALGSDEDAGTPTAQTELRIRSRLHAFATKELTRTLDQGISKSDPVVLTRSALMGENPEGVIVNERANGFDPENSSVATLGIGAVFTGVPVFVGGFVSGFVLVNTDQVSTSDGIEVQFSDTEAFTNIREGEQVFSYGTGDLNNGRFFGFEVTDLWMRVKYTNGGTAQGSFYLATFLSTQPLAQPKLPLNATIEDSDQAALFQGAILAKNPSGTWGRVERGPNGGLETHLDALRSIQASQQTITGTAAQVTASPLANRRTLILAYRGASNQDVYIGADSGVTTGNGFKMIQNEALVLELDGTATIYAIATAGSQSLHILELAE